MNATECDEPTAAGAQRGTERGARDAIASAPPRHPRDDVKKKEAVKKKDAWKTQQHRPCLVQRRRPRRDAEEHNGRDAWAVVTGAAAAGPGLHGVVAAEAPLLRDRYGSTGRHCAREGERWRARAPRRAHARRRPASRCLLPWRDDGPTRESPARRRRGWRAARAEIGHLRFGLGGSRGGASCDHVALRRVARVPKQDVGAGARAERDELVPDASGAQHLGQLRGERLPTMQANTQRERGRDTSADGQRSWRMVGFRTSVASGLFRALDRRAMIVGRGLRRVVRRPSALAP